jgi:hypothetical protein
MHVLSVLVWIEIENPKAPAVTRAIDGTSNEPKVHCCRFARRRADVSPD